MIKKILYIFIGFSLALSASVYGATILFPTGGGTGIGSATVGQIGSCLKVLTASPFIYELGTCGSGGGGSGGGTFATTTSTHAGRLINYPLNTTDIVVIGSNSTTTSAEFYFDPNLSFASFLGRFSFVHASGTALTISGASYIPSLNNLTSNGVIYTAGSNGTLNISGTSTPTVTAPITYSGTLGQFLNGVSGAFDCTSASAGVKGCITAADYSILKTATTTFTSPLTYTGATNAVTCSTCALTGTTLTINGTSNQITSSAGAQDLSSNRTWTLSFPNQVIFPQYASSTNGFSTPYASSTFLYGNNLITCDATTGKLTWASGQFGCGTDFNTGGGGGLSAYDAWTHPLAGQSATTSLMIFTGQASSTQISANIGFFNFFQATSTTATSTIANALAITAGITNGTSVEGTTDGTLNIQNTSSNALGLQVYTNQGATTDSPLVLFRSDNTAFDEGVLWLLQDGTAGGAYNLKNQGPAPQIEWVEADQSTPAGKFEDGVNGDIRYIASRDAGDTTFENAFTFDRLANGGMFKQLGTGVSFFTGRLDMRGQASTTGLSAGYASFGTTATTTIDNTGNVILNSGAFIKDGANILFGGNGTNSLFRPDSSGGVIQMQSFAGGVNTYFMDSGFVGIASSTPWKTLSIGAANVGGLAISTTTDGCAQFTKGELWITGSACGTGSGGTSAFEIATTSDIALSGVAYIAKVSGRTTIASAATSTLGVTGPITFSGTLGYQIGGSAGNFACATCLTSYDPFTHSNQYPFNSATTSKIAIGTTTPYYSLTIASTTGPQLALSDGTSGIAQWVFRNAGGSLYLSTTTVAGTATTSIPAIAFTGGQILIPDGTGSAPSISFLDDPNNGIGSPANDIFAIYTNGLERFRADDGTGRSAFGTTTPALGILTLASSTGQQLVLGDATAGDAQWGIRSAGGNLYFSTTTVAGTATTSSAALTIFSSGVPSMTIGTSTSNGAGCMTALKNGSLCLGGGGDSLGNTGSTTISGAKMQFDIMNNTGARQCAFFVGSTLVVTAGACTP